MENWFCLSCASFNCGRYVNGHALKHSNENDTHDIAISLLDLSFWCYKCSSYIENKSILNKYEVTLRDLKFGKNYIPDIEKVSNEGIDWQLTDEKIFSIKYFNFIEMIIKNKCKLQL